MENEGRLNNQWRLCSNINTERTWNTQLPYSRIFGIRPKTLWRDNPSGMATQRSDDVAASIRMTSGGVSVREIDHQPLAGRSSPISERESSHFVGKSNLLSPSA